MSEVAKRLRDRRVNVWEQAKEIADRASDENRAFSTEEENSWTALNSELDALDRRIKAMIDGEQRAKEAEEAMSLLDGGRTPEGKRALAGQDNAASEIRAWAAGNGPRALVVQPNGPVNYRDLIKGTGGGTSAGDVVPTSFYDRLVAHMIETSGVLRANPTILNTASGENIEVPKTTAHSTAILFAETTTLTESDPTFGQESLGAYKYGVMMQVSRELLTDTGVDLEGYLAMQAGRALGEAFGAHMISGDGSGKPSGIYADATAGVTGPTTASGGFGSQSVVGEGGDLLIDLFYSVIAPYRNSASCAWLLNDSTAGTVRKIKNSQGDYLWQPALTVGTPDTILGKPVHTDPHVASVATSASSVIFGDFSQFFVRLAGGIRFERSDDFAFSDDLVTFRALMRADSQLVDQTGAIKLFVGASA